MASDPSNDRDVGNRTSGGTTSTIVDIGPAPPRALVAETLGRGERVGRHTIGRMFAGQRGTRALRPWMATGTLTVTRWMSLWWQVDPTGSPGRRRAVDDGRVRRSGRCGHR